LPTPPITTLRQTTHLPLPDTCHRLRLAGAYYGGGGVRLRSMNVAMADGGNDGRLTDAAMDHGMGLAAGGGI